MNRRNISRKIRNRVNSWINSIEDEGLQDLVRGNTIVTGGAITSMLLDEEPNDYDLYFRNQDTAKAVAQYYVERFNELEKISYVPGNDCPDAVVVTQGKRVKVIVKSVGIARADMPDDYELTDGFEADDFLAGVKNPHDADDSGYEPLFITTNAITLSGGIQLVFRFHGSPREIHKNFDFVHCKNYWRSWAKPNQSLTLRLAALEHTLDKRLVYNQGSKYPLASLFRLRKFMKRGWYYSLSEVLKIVFDIQELDLSDPACLQEQLVGIDIAYFIEVIRRIRDDGVKEVSATYLAQVIEELW